MNYRRIFTALAFLSLLPLTAACSSIPKSQEVQAEDELSNDPFEPVNRFTFDANDFMDRLLIKPVTELYRFAIPDYARARISNVLSNMGEPVILANNLLQGEFTSAGITTGRFFTNTIVGGAGMYEVASDWGLQKQTGDFGQTLHTWGIGSGPYLVLPFFGPSDFRDAIGLGVDTVISPWQYAAADGGRAVRNEFNYTYFGVGGVDRREQTLNDYEALREGSLDFYAEMRSVYRQYRNKQLGVQNPDMSEGFDFKD